MISSERCARSMFECHHAGTCSEIVAACMQLVEIVMDLGRPPLARFPSGDLRLADDIISSADLEHAISKVNALLLNKDFQLMSPLCEDIGRCIYP